MKIKIELTSPKKIVLPRGFNEYIQAFIYSHLEIDKAKWLHDFGFEYEKRKFKLFVFSSILEKGYYNNQSKLFTFNSPISFYLSSPVTWILEQTAQKLMQSEKVQLGKNELNISSIAVLKQPIISNEIIKIKVISPIEVHSTFFVKNHEGKDIKKTHYYTPFEPEFRQMINSNLQKKWTALNKKDCPYSIDIRPLFRDSKYEKIRYFGTKEKKTVIKGWQYYFEIKALPEFLTFALDAGLGSRNSQGFGMIEYYL